MAKSRRKADDAPKQARFSVAAAAAFNIGLLLFLVSAAWDFLGPPSSSPAIHWCKLGLWCTGLAIAGPAWVVGSSFPTGAKLLISLAVVALVVDAAWSAEREFEAEAQVLTPWRVEGNRLVHDGLGLSVGSLAGWGVNEQVEVVADPGRPAPQRDRLGQGESAIFLRLMRRRADGKKGSFIVLRGGPGRLRSFDGAVAYMRKRQVAYAQEPGVKILTPLQSGLDGADSLQINWQDAQGTIWEEITFRSGSYILTILAKIVDDADIPPINDFLKSIRVTGRATGFDE